MNLKPQEKFSWQELINKKFVVVYISLALVSVINQVIFSVVLKDRDIVRASDSIIEQDFSQETSVSGEVLLPEEVIPVEEIKLAEEIILPEQVEINDLVQDDISKGIYYIGSDKKKHLFIDEVVFYTWYFDFKSVKIVSPDILATVLVGQDVYLRAGTYLVKGQDDSKIYAVEPGGKLVWIKNEVMAESLFGAQWSNKLIRLPVEIFNKYTISDKVVDTAVHPTGSLISYSGSNAVYYIDNGLKRYVSALVMRQNRFQDANIIKNVSPLIIYPDGPALEEMNVVGYWQ